MWFQNRRTLVSQRGRGSKEKVLKGWGRWVG